MSGLCVWVIVYLVGTTSLVAHPSDAFITKPTLELYRACSGSTYIKIGTIQRRLAWPLRKDDTQIREAFQIFAFVLMKCTSIPFIHAKKSSKEKQKHSQRREKEHAKKANS